MNPVLLVEVFPGVPLDEPIGVLAHDLGLFAWMELIHLGSGKAWFVPDTPGPSAYPVIY